MTDREVRRIEHRHQRIAALDQQLGRARLVGGGGGDDEDRAGASASRPVGQLAEGLDRVMRLVARKRGRECAGIPPNSEVERASSTSRTRDRISDPAPESSTRSPGSGERGDHLLCGGRGARLVGPAEEEDAQWRCRLLRSLRVIALGRLHRLGFPIYLTAIRAECGSAV